MYKAILFDLDGTLLSLDIEKFIESYFKKLSFYFKDYANPQLFIKELLKATEKMIKNPGEKTNEEVFMESFLPAINQERMKMEPLFERFYLEEFPRLKEEGLKNPLSQRLVEKAVKKGYKIVLATNPLFPKLAILHRMEWAGVKDNPWELITSYEEFHSAKPNLAYFKEIAAKIGLKPEECLMIGNDMQEDMLASQIGMGTFLVTDNLIDRGNPQYNLLNKGSLKQLEEFLSSLPDLA